MLNILKTKLLPRGLFGGGAAEEENDNGTADDYEYDEEVSKDHFLMDADLIPTESEKKNLLSTFSTMRKEQLFCDVAFVCNGVLFRAHRVLICAWSRWLRSLLMESPEEEVISLDLFDSSAFGMVLDYMYGVPLHLTVEVLLITMICLFIIYITLHYSLRNV